MNSIEIKLDSEVLFKQIINSLKSGEKILVKALESAIKAQLKSEFLAIFKGSLKKDVEVKIYNNYYRNRPVSIFDFKTKGYETWHIYIKLCCEKENKHIEEIKIVPIGFNLESISYGFGIEHNIKLKKKVLKTQVNYLIDLLHVKLLPEFFKGLDISVSKEGNELVLCNLNEEPQLGGLEVVSFIDAQSGEKYFCACSEQYHKYIISRCNELKARYVAGSWPHRLSTLLSKAVYRNCVCHFCIAKANGIDDAKTRYGDGILFHQRPYVSQIVFDSRLNKITALAEVRLKLGISKWKNEALLYSIVKSLFVNCSIEREYSPPWLDRQRLDIFLPKKMLAIEYQGEQHFKPVSIFGGKDAFEKVKDRDRQKLEKCITNNVNLVYFIFNEPLTKDYVKNKLRKYLNN